MNVFLTELEREGQLVSGGTSGRTVTQQKQILADMRQMLCITIGAMVAKKHKLLAAVGAYYGIQVAVTLVESVMLPTQILTVAGESSLFYRIFGINIILTVILCLAGYFWMHHLADKKLNLA